MFKTEDVVRQEAKDILVFGNCENAVSDVGQLTTFNTLGFKGVKDKPDGWYLPHDKHNVAIVLEAKNSKIDISKKRWINELTKNISIIERKYKKVIGVLYNGEDVIVYKNGERIETVEGLQNKEYYFSLYADNKIDKQRIYTLTKRINNLLHFKFGVKNLYHRMIFTACALVAERYDAELERVKNLGYATFHTRIHETLSKSFQAARRQNEKLDLMLAVYAEIRMNTTDDQAAINDFIDAVVEISHSINSDYWHGEEVMAIFFNEFNRYKKKSESGQVFTPDHITSFMYRLIGVCKDDVVLDAACGSGAFLVKSMCNMIKEAGGVSTKKAAEIKAKQLYGIELDREIFALACANMLIHKDGKTNLAQMDSRTQQAMTWVKDKKITKVLMNPPFENKYGCVDIVRNVLDNVDKGVLCAFIMPDKKLEKVSSAKKILRKHTLLQIIKLPEKVFNEGVTTSVFVFKAGTPQNDSEIFACYIDDDGLETVKNQGRQDVKNRWPAIENRWIKIIQRQGGDASIQWIDPNDHLSYQMPKKPFELFEEDFTRTIVDYEMFRKGVDMKSLSEKLAEIVLYSGEVKKVNNGISIKV